MSTYLQPKEDKILMLPRSSTMLNLETTQIWTAVKRFKRDDNEAIAYALKLDGDTSPATYLVGLEAIASNFNVVSDGQELPPANLKNALDLIVRYQ